ncbi:MAG: membrane protein insertase YidC [Burkholderiales bacterium]
MIDKRLITLMIFLFAGFTLWEGWQARIAPPKAPVGATSTAAVPQASSGNSATSASVLPAAAPALAGDTFARGERVTVRTDKFLAEIDTIGGGIRKLTLLQHYAAEDTSKPFTLMQDNAAPFYITRSGLLGDGLPNHNSVFAAQAKEYTLEAGKSTLEVRLDAPDANGVKIAKRFVFHRDSYVIDESFDITNNGSAALQPSAYFELLRDSTPPPGDQRFVSTFTGPAFYNETEKFQKIDFSNIDKGKENKVRKSREGWVAMLQHYFVAAWIPKAGSELEFYTRKVGDKYYSAGVVVPVAAVPAGATASVTVPLYAGPEEVEKMRAIAPGLDLTIDYSWLTIVATPLFWLLSKIHDYVGNWGVAIIVLTVIIKAAFYHLSAKQYKSMAQMKVLGPKVEKLKQQYGDDRVKMNQAMMELYKKEKINPLSGCLPIFLQMPIFLALYWVLLGAVELRHAPFALWIKDLSAADPYYVLPVLYGITMFITTKLNPPPPDPIQAKMMTIMPLMFSVFFFFFPAGLVLYYTVNNILSIAQQWMITRTHAADAAATGNAKR